MASDKQRRKAAKAKQPKMPGPFRHPDGDRRHREAMRAAVKAIKAKEQMQRLYGAVELPEED